MLIALIWLMFSLMVLGPIGAWLAFLLGRTPQTWAVASGVFPLIAPIVLIFLPPRPRPTPEQIRASAWPRLGLYMLIALFSTLLLLVIVFAFLSQVPGAFNPHLIFKG